MRTVMRPVTKVLPFAAAFAAGFAAVHLYTSFADFLALVDAVVEQKSL